MKRMIFSAIFLSAVCGTSSSAFACNPSEALRALHLEDENPNSTLDRLGYDFGAVAGAAAQISDHFAQEGCRLDKRYFLVNVWPGTQLGQIQRFVRFL